MGLVIHVEGDFSRNVDWSYTGFMNFRSAIARKLWGVDLTQMSGFDVFGAGRPWEDRHKENSLWPLLMHSDCDGIMSPAECQKIAPALRFVAQGLDEQWRNESLALADLMDAAAAASQRLVFA